MKVEYGLAYLDQENLTIWADTGRSFKFNRNDQPIDAIADAERMEYVPKKTWEYNGRKYVDIGKRSVKGELRGECVCLNLYGEIFEVDAYMATRPWKNDGLVILEEIPEIRHCDEKGSAPTPVIVQVNNLPEWTDGDINAFIAKRGANLNASMHMKREYVMKVLEGKIPCKPDLEKPEPLLPIVAREWKLI